MTTYAIYAKPSDRKAEDAIFVPDTFCWGGFILTGFWVLWNRMWIVSSIVIAVLFIGTALPTILQFLVNVGVSVFLGLHGHDLLGWSLKRRGFSEVGLSAGNTLEEAEFRFYAEGLSTPSFPSPPLKEFDELGLFGAKS
jgi:hypothetical protein